MRSRIHELGRTVGGTRSPGMPGSRGAGHTVLATRAMDGTAYTKEGPMKRRAAVVLCAFGVVGLAMVPAASAKSDAQCNGNRVLTQVSGSSLDRNDDGYVCAKGAGAAHDNKVKIAEASPSPTAACPSGFTAEPDNSLSTADANGNGRVCVDHVTGAVQDDVDGLYAPPPAVGPGHGVCPPTFVTDAASSTQALVVDRNGNGVVCRQAATSTLVDDA